MMTPALWRIETPGGAGAIHPIRSPSHSRRSAGMRRRSVHDPTRTFALYAVPAQRRRSAGWRDGHGPLTRRGQAHRHQNPALVRQSRSHVTSENQPVVVHREQVRRAARAQPEHAVACQRESVSRRSLGGARVSLRTGTATGRTSALGRFWSKLARRADIAGPASFATVRSSTCRVA